MRNKVTGVFSSVSQLKSDIEETTNNRRNVSSKEFYTVDTDIYKELKQNTSLEGTLLITSNTSAEESESGIHNLATAFDEDDGSIELMQLEESLRKEGFSKKDASECKTYLHKRMIVVTEKV